MTSSTFPIAVGSPASLWYGMPLRLCTLFRPTALSPSISRDIHNGSQNVLILAPRMWPKPKLRLDWIWSPASAIIISLYWRAIHLTWTRQRSRVSVCVSDNQSSMIIIVQRAAAITSETYTSIIYLHDDIGMINRYGRIFKFNRSFQSILSPKSLCHSIVFDTNLQAAANGISQSKIICFIWSRSKRYE